VRTLKTGQIAAALWLSSLAVSPSASVAAPERPAIKRVLMLHEGAVGFSPIRDRFGVVFTRTVRSATSAQFEVYEETLETSRFPAPEQFRLVREFLVKKYADRKIDVIATMGVPPLALARQLRPMIGSPPIVATLSPTGQIDASDSVTGLQGGFFINGTIDLALTLQPDTQSVLVVDGGFEDNTDLQAEVERQVKARSRTVGLVYLRNLPLSDVTSRVAAAPEHSIVLYIKQNLRTGTQPMSPFDAVVEVTRASRVPVFSQVEEYIGLGVLGGYVWDFEVDARRMAEMAVRLATGASVHDVPPGRNTYKTVLDWRQLERWGIPESRVPAASVILFRQSSFFEMYRRYVVGGLLIFSAQLALIVGLLVQRARRHRAEEESRNSERRYRSVVDSQTEMVCRFLPDSTLTFVNDAYCRFWGKTRTELLGQPFIQLVPPEARESVLEHVRSLRSGTDSHEHQVTLRDGTIGWHHWTNQAIVDERGGLIELQGVGRDITESRRAMDLNRDLAGRLIASQEEERHRIARELHDDLSQKIALLNIEIDQVAGQLDAEDARIHLQRISGQAAEIATDVHNLSHELHPSRLQIIGLRPAFESLCREMSRQGEVQVVFTHGVVPEVVDPNVSLCLYRITQEALRNVMRHSRASEVQVRLWRHGDSLELQIADSGIGFNHKVEHPGLGLVSIRERVALLRGQLAIHSAPGAGTRIGVRVPLSRGD
jgi:PAS domain S-box-containing protein